MIETQQVVAIDAGIDRVWDHVREIGGWAALMPGFRSFEPIDADRSRWVLKVGVGALVRTVTVLVQVDRWAGPGHVAFSYSLEGDPVDGDGSYAATGDDTATEVTLDVRVRGSGKLAPMWEAMGRPLLPKFARTFAAQLKQSIEDRGAVE